MGLIHGLTKILIRIISSNNSSEVKSKPLNVGNTATNAFEHAVKTVNITPMWFGKCFVCLNLPIEL